MRDDDQAALVSAHVILEPADRFQVEVVGGLIEQQDGGIAKQGLRQQHAHLLAALQFAHFAIVQASGISRPSSRTAASLSAVYPPSSPTMPSSSPRRMPSSSVKLSWVFGVQYFAFLQRGPQRRIAHDDGIDHAEAVEGKLVLAQHAHFLGPGDGAFMGRSRRS